MKSTVGGPAGMLNGSTDIVAVLFQSSLNGVRLGIAL